MKQVTCLIKPASSLCTMRCQYCFYLDESAQRSQPSAGIMQAKTSEQLIRRALEAVDRHGQITFAFQGGEPTLAGLTFFAHFVQAVAVQNQKRAAVQYALQTNGLAIDESWARFLARHHFLVGISLDGDKAIHDAFRLDTAGKGTWNRVMRSVALLQRERVECNALCVVTRPCAKSPVKVYNRLKKLGFSYLQFIPCLDPLGRMRGCQPYSLPPTLYGDFLCAVFDAWYQDWRAGQYTSVRLFDDYIHLLMGHPAGTCSTTGNCGAYCTVEADGTVYPCDFYCLDTWRMGTLQAMDLPMLLSSPTAQRFQAQGVRRPAECWACPWYRLCGGGCPRDRYYDETGTHNYWCPAFQAFFAHAYPRMQQIAKEQQRFG